MSSNHASSEELPAVKNEKRIDFHTLNYMAIQYATQGCIEMAMLLCKQAYEELDISAGVDNPKVATLLNSFHIVSYYQSKYKKAIDLLHDALAMGEETLGENHPENAVTLNNLAVLYSRRGKNKEAEPLCKRALQIREKILGKDHPEVAKQLNNLALLCQNQNKYKEATQYFQRAHAIYEASFGPDDSNTVKIKTYLVSCYSKQKSYEDTNPSTDELLQQVSTEQDLLQTSPESMAKDVKTEISAVGEDDDSKPILQIPVYSFDGMKKNREEKVISTTFSEKDSMLSMSSIQKVKSPGIKSKIFRILKISKDRTPA